LSLANSSVSMECEKFDWSMSSIKQEGSDLIVQMLGSDYDNGSRSGNISLTVYYFIQDVLLKSDFFSDLLLVDCLRKGWLRCSPSSPSAFVQFESDRYCFGQIKYDQSLWLPVAICTAAGARGQRPWRRLGPGQREKKPR
jgi:hypothetical protein